MNGFRAYARLPIKAALLAAVLLAVCFPYPLPLLRQLKRMAHPNQLIEPQAPALQPFVEELEPLLTKDTPPDQTKKIVERYVYRKVPYDWDWNTWGIADYWPTVSEVIAKGREDCDGQAVVAASLMRRFGLRADLVNDFSHMWVRTDHGDAMSPGQRAIVTREGETSNIHWTSALLLEFPKAVGLGIAVFPLSRELIVALALWILMLRENGGWRIPSILAVFFVGGLLLVRHGGGGREVPVVWAQLAGLTLIVAAFLIHARAAMRMIPHRDMNSIHPDGPAHSALEQPH